VPGGRRCHHEGGVRGLPGVGLGAFASARAGGGDGQSLFSQGREGKRAHRRQRLCELLYLPPYSPDLNPIEEAFAKLKALVHRAGARTREAVIKALGRALEAVTARDACGYFEHRGYRAPGQLL
jgi:DDE superfamily endonuclease